MRSQKVIVISSMIVLASAWGFCGWYFGENLFLWMLKSPYNMTRFFRGDYFIFQSNSTVAMGPVIGAAVSLLMASFWDRLMALLIPINNKCCRAILRVWTLAMAITMGLAFGGWAHGIYIHDKAQYYLETAGFDHPNASFVAVTIVAALFGAVVPLLYARTIEKAGLRLQRVLLAVGAGMILGVIAGAASGSLLHGLMMLATSRYPAMAVQTGLAYGIIAGTWAGLLCGVLWAIFSSGNAQQQKPLLLKQSAVAGR